LCKAAKLDLTPQSFARLHALDRDARRWDALSPD
jgi:hypothetical protein